MLHPNTEVRFVNPQVGNGVFALKEIPAGTIVWVRDPLDREFTPDEFYAHPPLLLDSLLTYSYRNHKGNYIFCWDNTKYINHSFSPNCMTTPYGFEIAIRHIRCHEELTNDYGTLNIIEPFAPIDEGSDRKWVHPNDIKTYFKEWDLLIGDAIGKIGNVSQPLWELMPTNTKDELLSIANNHKKARSILDCLFDGPPNEQKI